MVEARKVMWDKGFLFIYIYIYSFFFCHTYIFIYILIYAWEVLAIHHITPYSLFPPDSTLASVPFGNGEVILRYQNGQLKTPTAQKIKLKIKS